MKYLLVAVLALLIVSTTAVRYSLFLRDWNFTLNSSSTSYPAKIPSTLSLDLIENRLVKADPYYRSNFLDFYAFESTSATYTTHFVVPTAYLSSKYQTLTFEGLDTHCEVLLNNVSILKADNMFRRYEVNVKFKASNELVVKFKDNVAHDLQK